MSDEQEFNETVGTDRRKPDLSKSQPTPCEVLGCYEAACYFRGGPNKAVCYSHSWKPDSEIVWKEDI